MIKECFDSCRGSGGHTSLKNLLLFEDMDLEDSCLWYVEKGINKGGHKVKYIVLGIVDKEEA